MSARLHVGPVLLRSQGVLNRLLLNVIQQQTLRQLPPLSLPREMLQRAQLQKVRLVFTLKKDHTLRQSLPLLESVPSASAQHHEQDNNFCIACSMVSRGSPVNATTEQRRHLAPHPEPTARTIRWRLHDTELCRVIVPRLLEHPARSLRHRTALRRSELNDLLATKYNTRPLTTPPGIRPREILLYTVLGIRPHREIQHQIHINNSILVCHPPQRKYTLPELKRLLLSSLATNHAPRLL